MTHLPNLHYDPSRKNLCGGNDVGTTHWFCTRIEKIFGDELIGCCCTGHDCERDKEE